MNCRPVRIERAPHNRAPPMTLTKRCVSAPKNAPGNCADWKESLKRIDALLFAWHALNDGQWAPRRGAPPGLAVALVTDEEEKNKKKGKEPIWTK